jgi:hypothetical protein
VIQLPYAAPDCVVASPFCLIHSAELQGIEVAMCSRKLIQMFLQREPIPHLSSREQLYS